MEKLQTKQKIGMVIVAILTVLGLVPTVIYASYGPIWSTIICIIMYILIIIYALLGYKKPHGNMLKYLYMIYGLSLLASITTLIINGDVYSGLSCAVVMLLVGYIAGRLHRIKQNVVFMVIVTLFLAFAYGKAAVTLKVSFLGTMGIISPLIMWIDLCTAYFLRYKEHKEAGLMDAPKK